MRDIFGALADEHALRVDVGGDSDGMPQAYVYSPDLRYRYAFARWWGQPQASATAVWVLLNPATGDTERRRRPTLDRCITWSRRAGFAGLAIVNLFAYRHTDPRELRRVADPVGPANDDALAAVTSAGGRTIVAWGTHGSVAKRSSMVGPLLSEPMCLGTTRSGEPRHPLYVSADTPLTVWSPPGPAGG